MWSRVAKQSATQRASFAAERIGASDYGTAEGLAQDHVGAKSRALVMRLVASIFKPTCRFRWL